MERIYAVCSTRLQYNMRDVGQVPADDMSVGQNNSDTKAQADIFYSHTID